MLNSLESGQHEKIPRLTKSEKKALKKEKAKEGRVLKRKLNRKRKSLDNKFLSEDEKAAYRADVQLKRETEQQKIKALFNSMESGQRICIDLGFEHPDQERNSIFKQLCLTYNSLKRSEVPLSWHLTSVTEDMNTALITTCGMSKWPVAVHKESPTNLFPSRDLVVLSPDATDVIDHFEMSKIYVIGGMADRTVRKSITLNYALSNNLTVMRLPVQEYLSQRQTHVLNIDTVFTIIWRFMLTGDWTTVLNSTVPSRRQQSKADRKRKVEVEEIHEGQEENYLTNSTFDNSRYDVISTLCTSAKDEKDECKERLTANYSDSGFC